MTTYTTVAYGASDGLEPACFIGAVLMPHIATVRDVAEDVPMRNPSRKQSNLLPFWRRKACDILCNTEDISGPIQQHQPLLVFVGVQLYKSYG